LAALTRHPGGVFLDFLSAYRPELNRIEPVFQQIKHHEIPCRSHKSKAELRASVETGFESSGRTLNPKREEKLRPAAETLGPASRPKPSSTYAPPPIRRKIESATASRHSLQACVGLVVSSSGFYYFR
jgi:hypothetical protein